MTDPNAIVKTGYNRCARAYSDRRDLFANQKYLDDLAARLPPQARVLDLGCGSGIPVDQFLLENGFDVTGIDVSEAQINLAKQNLPRGSFAVQDMRQVVFPEGSFDAVVSFYAIFHIPREEHLSLLKKLHYLLKPTGYLLITMGSSAWEGTEDDFHGVRMFWSHYGREKNLELVQHAGFKTIYEIVDTSGDERHQVILAEKQEGS